MTTAPDDSVLHDPLFMIGDDIDGEASAIHSQVLRNPFDNPMRAVRQGEKSELIFTFAPMNKTQKRQFKNGLKWSFATTKRHTRLLRVSFEDVCDVKTVVSLTVKRWPEQKSRVDDPINPRRSYF